MEQAIPTIYAPPVVPIRLSLYARLLCFAIVVACLVLAATAWRLTPSPDGVGTHQQMGMLGCSMLTDTGLPCPSCGMTTSFAWFFKAHFVASFYIQPAGFALAYLVSFAAVGAFYEGVTGRPVHRLLRIIPAQRWIILGCTVLAFGWGWKIITHLTGVDGW